MSKALHGRLAFLDNQLTVGYLTGSREPLKSLNKEATQSVLQVSFT